MSAVREESQRSAGTARTVFFAYATAALLLGLVTAFFYVRRSPMHSLFELPFYIGQTSWQLIIGRGLSCFVYPMPNTIVWMRAARMPVATLYATAAILYLGPSQLKIATLLKTALLLLPVLGAARMVLYRCSRSKRLLLFCTMVLAIPFFVPSFLADVVSLQAEEGYSYAFLVIAFTLVALWPRRDAVAFRSVLLYTMATAAALDLLYLSKSSMILVVAVLLAFSLLRNGPMWSRVVLLLLVALAPLGWAMRQHAVSGRYAIGTSFDGGNFHKGNYDRFLTHYPPAEGSNLDFFDSEIAPPQPLGGEWAYNDWHNHEAILFIRSHPGATLVGWEKKFYVFLIALHVYGNGSVSMPRPVALFGMILFRLLLLFAAGMSVYALFRRDGWCREAGFLYLALVGACAVPYLAGFGYTRHASVLIYPSAVAICLLSVGSGRKTGLLADRTQGEQAGAEDANG